MVDNINNIPKEIYTKYININRLYQLLHLLVDFSAAILFLVGSVLFLYPNLIEPGTWMFIVGSLFFSMKPTIKLCKFFHLRRILKKTKSGIEHLFKLDSL